MRHVYNSTTGTCAPCQMMGTLARNDSGTSEGTHPWVLLKTSDGGATWVVTFHTSEDDADMETGGIDSRTVTAATGVVT